MKNSRGELFEVWWEQTWYLSSRGHNTRATFCATCLPFQETIASNCSSSQTKIALQNNKTNQCSIKTDICAVLLSLGLWESTYLTVIAFSVACKKSQMQCVFESKLVNGPKGIDKFSSSIPFSPFNNKNNEKMNLSLSSIDWWNNRYSFFFVSWE